MSTLLRYSDVLEFLVTSQKDTLENEEILLIGLESFHQVGSRAEKRKTIKRIQECVGSEKGEVAQGHPQI